MGPRVPRPRTSAAGPGETLPQRTPGASDTGWPDPAVYADWDYVRIDGPEVAGETDFPPPPEVLDRVLDALRKLS